MIALILFVVFGICFAYFATLNTLLTTVNLGGYVIKDIPLYIVILLPFACGLVIGGFFAVAKDFFNQRILHRQSSQLSKAKQETVGLLKEVHRLELENAKLTTKLGDEDTEDTI